MSYTVTLGEKQVYSGQNPPMESQVPPGARIEFWNWVLKSPARGPIYRFQVEGAAGKATACASVGDYTLRVWGTSLQAFLEVEATLESYLGAVDLNQPGDKLDDVEDLVGKIEEGITLFLKKWVDNLEPDGLMNMAEALGMDMSAANLSDDELAAKVATITDDERQLLATELEFPLEEVNAFSDLELWLAYTGVFPDKAAS